jgi:hypothetical protein
VRVDSEIMIGFQLLAFAQNDDLQFLLPVKDFNCNSVGFKRISGA